MSTEKKLKRAHERMQMELMEPRMLLSADLLALAGLPG
ncbi:MAG: LEPR-XLL domain-containing protein, partial [Gammaproteobacteria bacterium]|nr:LEPR-XLL domain-containing protein [Gammaproteobacteria bacterium]